MTLHWDCTVSKDGQYMCRSCGSSSARTKAIIGGVRVFRSTESVANHGKMCKPAKAVMQKPRVEREEQFPPAHADDSGSKIIVAAKLWDTMRAVVGADSQGQF